MAETSDEGEKVEKARFLGHPNGYLSGEARIERAWAHWKKLGQPRLMVAPMVDCSELPFRMLCRKYGAQAAYTPMLHSRIFTENEKYRSMEFTTCQVSLLPLPFSELGFCKFFGISELIVFLVYTNIDIGYLFCCFDFLN